MKKIQKNLRGSFNVFSNSARQLEVPLKEAITAIVIYVTIFALLVRKGLKCFSECEKCVKVKTDLMSLTESHRNYTNLK